jgi:RHS repeat-associated protein
LIAEYSTQTPSQNPTTKYLSEDHLGTPRVITDSVGNIVSRRDFMPFGEELTINVGERSNNLKYGTTADNVRQKFTGYQKDDETGLDFAEARMYENKYGRFTAVDPLLASGKSSNPQTFNRYVHTLNNPIVMVDSNGLYPVYFKWVKGKRWFSNTKSDGYTQQYLGKKTIRTRAPDGSLWIVTSSSMKRVGADVPMPDAVSRKSKQKAPVDISPPINRDIVNSFATRGDRALTYASRAYGGALLLGLGIGGCAFYCPGVVAWGGANLVPQLSTTVTAGREALSFLGNSFSASPFAVRAAAFGGGFGTGMFMAQFDPTVSGGGSRTFPNQLPQDLQSDLDTAARLGVQPLQPGSAGFNNLVKENARIKWAVDESRQLFVVPYEVNGIEIKHSVLTGGNPVLAAGDAQLAGTPEDPMVFDITNRSGHFRPGPANTIKQIGRNAFRASGVTPLE